MKKLKWLLFSICAIILCGGVFCAVYFSCEANTRTEIETETEDDASQQSISGSVDIATAKELYDFSQKMKNSSVWSSVDINLTSNYYNMNGYSWVPFGNTSTRAYRGTFNGNNAVIANLNVSSANYAGLFGHLGPGATIKNFAIVKSTVATTGSNHSYAGVLAGAIQPIVSSGSYSTEDLNVTIEDVFICDCTVKTAACCGILVGAIDRGTEHINGAIKISNCQFSRSYVSSGTGVIRLWGDITTKGAVISGSSELIKVSTSYDADVGAIILGDNSDSSYVDYYNKFTINISGCGDGNVSDIYINNNYTAVVSITASWDKLNGYEWDDYNVTSDTSYISVTLNKSSSNTNFESAINSQYSAVVLYDSDGNWTTTYLKKCTQYTWAEYYKGVMSDGHVTTINEEQKFTTSNGASVSLTHCDFVGWSQGNVNSVPNTLPTSFLNTVSGQQTGAFTYHYAYYNGTFGSGAFLFEVWQMRAEVTITVETVTIDSKDGACNVVNTETIDTSTTYNSSLGDYEKLYVGETGTIAYTATPYMTESSGYYAIPVAYTTSQTRVVNQFANSNMTEAKEYGDFDTLLENGIELSYDISNQKAVISSITFDELVEASHTWMSNNGGTLSGNFLIIFYKQIDSATVGLSVQSEDDGDKTSGGISYNYPSNSDISTKKASDSVYFHNWIQGDSLEGGSVEFGATRLISALACENPVAENLAGAKWENKSAFTGYWCSNYSTITDSFTLYIDCNQSYKCVYTLTYSNGSTKSFEIAKGGSTGTSGVVVNMYQDGVYLTKIDITFVVPITITVEKVTFYNPDRKTVTITDYSVGSGSGSLGQGIRIYYTVPYDFSITAVNNWNYSKNTHSATVCFEFSRSYSIAKIYFSTQMWTDESVRGGLQDANNGKGSSDTTNTITAKGATSNESLSSTTGTVSSGEFYWRETVTYVATAGEGYEFVGWYTASGSKITDSATYQTVLNERTSFTDAKNTTYSIYARFELIDYTVTVNTTSGAGAFQFVTSYTNTASTLYTEKTDFTCKYKEYINKLVGYSSESYFVKSITIGSGISGILKETAQNANNYSYIEYTSNGTAGVQADDAKTTIYYTKNMTSKKSASALTFSNNVCYISTEAELARLAYEINYAQKDYSNYLFVLSSNISISSDVVVDPIGKYNYTYYSDGLHTAVTNAFSGRFVGNGNKISNLTFDARNYYKGLFGYVKGAEIDDLYVSMADTQSGGNYRAVLAGYVIDSKILHIALLSGTVNCANSSSVGGLIGYMASSNLSECISCATITGTNSSGTFLFVGASGSGNTISNLCKNVTTSSPTDTTSFVNGTTVTQDTTDGKIWSTNVNGQYYLAWFFYNND